MHRTQIYLTKDENTHLHHIAKLTGKTKSQLMREAIDAFINQFEFSGRIAILKKAQGLWEKRTDLPDFQQLRREFDRKNDDNK